MALKALIILDLDVTSLKTLSIIILNNSILYRLALRKNNSNLKYLI